MHGIPYRIFITMAEVLDLSLDEIIKAEKTKKKPARSGGPGKPQGGRTGGRGDAPIRRPEG